jgi:uncharacterized SAM-binding protein YcdF (DUF218 family)
MQIYLHKILPVFFLPVGLTLIFIMAGLLFRRRSFIWLGFFVLWLSSTPLIGDFLFRNAEAWAERTLAIEALQADAIVVLSGGRVLAPGVAAVSEWGSADRFFGGVELFQAGKAPLLVFTGGGLPWESAVKSEGELLIEYALALGVPTKSMFTTGAVVNTEAEAEAVADLLLRRSLAATGQARPHVLLVTSAFHMPRAQQLFEREGLRVTPFPVDFQVPVRTGVGVLDFVPSAVAVGHTEMAWREMYGRLYYGVRSALKYMYDGACWVFLFAPSHLHSTRWTSFVLT